MILKYILCALIFIVGIGAGISLCVWIYFKRLEIGTMIVRDEHGKWKGCVKAFIELTGNLCFPNEHLQEWLNECDRVIEI